ncbi:MAG TPA: N-acyl homoserine lactonase family protein [Candidatus Micrarchaeia archaeon]|nr:N-acyl homoserine lactonase family protein [Candidatus Micrarchaeia archaeon]
MASSRTLTLADVRRVDLGAVTAPPGDPDAGSTVPVHGFAVTHPAGVVLIDTGVGEPRPGSFVRDWRPVARRIDVALAELGLAAADVRMVVNTHLHWDHCGQNAVFTHAPFVVQRREHETARGRQGIVWEWFEVAHARFELVDGEREILPGLRVVPTYGHTVGHQAVVVETDQGTVVLGGDAADSAQSFAAEDCSLGAEPEDRARWREAVRQVKALDPLRVLFCHDPTAWQRGGDGGPPPAAG